MSATVTKSQPKAEGKVTPEPKPKADPKPKAAEPVKFTDLEKLEPGTYRVAFEKRSTWSAELEKREGTVYLCWRSGDAKQHRDFATAKSGIHVHVPSKPSWGNLTRIAAA